MPNLVYHESPEITFASNVFINVPIILQFDDEPLISVVSEEELGYTTEIPIYHPDGTYLAKVRGTRVYPTEAGRTAGVEVRQFPNLWVCTIEGRTAFEIQQGAGDRFTTTAELFTPTGQFVRVADGMPQALDASGQVLQLSGLTLMGNVFQNVRIGVWVRSDGTFAIGCP